MDDESPEEDTGLQSDARGGDVFIQGEEAENDDGVCCICWIAYSCFSELQDFFLLFFTFFLVTRRRCLI